MRLSASFVFGTIATLFFAVFLAWPVFHVLEGAFIVEGRLSLDAFLLAFDNTVFVESIRNSLLVAVIVTTLATLVAFPVAYLFARFEFRGKGLLQGFLLLALVLPPFVASIGIRQLLARFGSVNLALLEVGLIDQPIDFLGSWPLLGVIVLSALHLYPILFLNLTAALGNVDPALLEAASSVGASRWTRFRRVTVPLVMPGFFAGAVIVFIFALTDLGSPLVFGAHRLVPVQIFERVTEGSRDPVGYALVVIVLLLSTLLYVSGRAAIARRPLASATKGSVRATSRTISWRAWLFLGPALLLLILVTLLPHASVALVAFSDRWFFSILPERYTLQHFESVMTDPIAYLGVRNSLTYASCSTLIDIALGLAIAWMVVRSNSRFARWLDACAMLPLALPGVVLAFGYANCFTGTPLEEWLDPLKNPMLIIVFGYSMRRLPYVVRAADAGMRQVPVMLEEAARNMGASSLATLRRVTIPLVAASLLAGGLLAFSFAMLEVSESLILAPSEESYPITKAIYLLLGDIFKGPQIGSAMGVIGTVILLYALIAASRLLGRSLGEMFRT